MVATEILADNGSKRLLALDGGGIRGLIALEVLAKIESMLREHYAKDDLVLSDYFHYISGTSTGAIIAAALSLGHSIDFVREFYIKSGDEMFDRAGLLERFKYKFRSDKLAGQLREVIGADTTLGSDKLKTLLMMVLRNATTDSPWPLSNHPDAMFNDRSVKGCNLDLSLWQLVRASTAAPTYFPPEVIEVGDNSFVFVDGGITMYNNPAFHMFLMATLEPYRCCWTPGEDRMLIVSLGTGFADDANKNLQPSEMNLLYNAGSLPSALMTAALHEQDLLCRTFGRCLEGSEIDMEIGDLRNEQQPIVGDKLFTYVRYQVELSSRGFDHLIHGDDASRREPRISSLLADKLRDVDPVAVRSMDSVSQIPNLQVVGQATGEALVSKDHFAKFLQV